MTHNFLIPTAYASALLLACATLGSNAAAKPLLTNSQSTYASACIEQADTPERLVEICQHALDEADASDAQRIEMLDRLAWAYFDLDELAQSRGVFEQILAIDPKAEPGLQGVGWVLYMQDDYTAATEYFRQAVAQKPTAPNLSGLAASQRWDGQIDLEEFENYMRAALALDPEYRWGIRELAWALTYDHQFDAATELFNSALELDDEDANAEYGLAYVLTEQDLWDEALTHVNRALDLSPNYVSALSRRSLILLMLDRPKQALKDAELVIDARPNSADGYVRKARALSELGRRSAAHAVLDEAEARAGVSNYLTYWQASLLFDDAEYDTALAIIRRSVETEDADHYDFRLHAEIALELEKIAEARSAIDQALSYQPDSYYSRYINALILVEEQQFDAAEEMFDSAIEAGLSEDYLDDFMSALIAQGRMFQAIKMRVRYS